MVIKFSSDNRIRFVRRVPSLQNDEMAPGNDDHDSEMSDAAPGAEANGSTNGDFVREKQRLRLVRATISVLATFDLTA